jgi:DNA-binding protein H-NS
VSTLQDLIAQRDALDAAIKAQQASAHSDAVVAARKFCAEHGLASADVFPTRAGAPAADRKPIAVKYRDDKGNTWTGRGVKPRWLTNALANGANQEQFRV